MRIPACVVRPGPRRWVWRSLFRRIQNQADTLAHGARRCLWREGRRIRGERSAGSRGCVQASDGRARVAAFGLTIWVSALGRLCWLAVGLGCGAFVEAAQALLLPHRDPSWSYILANGAGVFLGYLLLDAGSRLRWWRFPRGIVVIADWTRGEPMLRKIAIVLALPVGALVVIPFLVQLTLGGPGPTPERRGEVPGISPVKVPHPLHPATPR